MMKSNWIPSYVPPNLRERALFAHFNENQSVEEVANRFYVSQAGVYRWLDLYEETGDVCTQKEIDKKNNTYTKPSAKISQQPEVRKALYAQLDDKSASTLYEYQYMIY